MSYYRKFNEFLQKTFGEKVWKISLDAGLSCPNKNKDGKGCIFCRNDSFSHHSSAPAISVRRQMEQGMAKARNSRNISKFIAYLQTGTNTFAPISLLEELYRQAIDFDGVVGLSVATRPDCLSDDALDLLAKLAKKIQVWVELGLQSADDQTLATINRGHTFADYETAVIKLSKINVRVCTHIMIGLPGESFDTVQYTARQIAKTSTHEVKIHPLLILKGTGLESLCQKGQVSALSFQSYVEQVCDFLELLPPDMVIQRLTAEAPDELLIAPLWAKNKLAVLNAINQEFIKRGTRQGSRFMDSTR